jgi:hypothetical protein
VANDVAAVYEKVATMLAAWNGAPGQYMRLLMARLGLVELSSTPSTMTGNISLGRTNNP